MPWLEWLGRATFLGDTHDAHGEFCSHQSRHADTVGGVHPCTAGAAEAMRVQGAPGASPKGGVSVRARMPAFVPSALGAAVDESVASVRLLRASAFFDLGAPDVAEEAAAEESEEAAEAEEAAGSAAAGFFLPKLMARILLPGCTAQFSAAPTRRTRSQRGAVRR